MLLSRAWRKGNSPSPPAIIPPDRWNQDDPAKGTLDYDGGDGGGAILATRERRTAQEAHTIMHGIVPPIAAYAYLTMQ